MNGILSKLYLQSGDYFREIGEIKSQKQSEYLKGAKTYYEKGLEIVNKETQNKNTGSELQKKLEELNTFCTRNGFNIM